MASLKQRLRDDLTAAMRAQNEIVRTTLRSVLAAITKAEVAGKQQSTLDDDQVVGVIRAELGKRKEAGEIYLKAGRGELAAREQAEADVLRPYLPPELSDQDLAAIVAEEVARMLARGVVGPRAIGATIQSVRERVGVQAEGSRIAQVVKSALAEQ